MNREYYVYYAHQITSSTLFTNSVLFSTAGNLTDPHMDTHFLALLTSIMKNKSAYNPPVAKIQEKYYQLFRAKGDMAKGESSSDAEVKPPPFDREPFPHNLLRSLTSVS